MSNVIPGFPALRSLKRQITLEDDQVYKRINTNLNSNGNVEEVAG